MLLALIALIESFLLIGMIKGLANHDMDIRGAFVLAFSAAISIALLPLVLPPELMYLALLVPALGVTAAMMFLFRIDVFRSFLLGVGCVGIHLVVTLAFALLLQSLRLAAEG